VEGALPSPEKLLQVLGERRVAPIETDGESSRVLTESTGNRGEPFGI
jgi:hypothetical protein